MEEVDPRTTLNEVVERCTLVKTLWRSDQLEQIVIFSLLHDQVDVIIIF